MTAFNDQKHLLHLKDRTPLVHTDILLPRSLHMQIAKKH